MNEHAVPADLHKLVDSAILAARRDATYKTADTMQAAVQARMALLAALSTQEASPNTQQPQEDLAGALRLPPDAASQLRSLPQRSVPAAPPCNKGNLCPWTDGDPSYCRRCGERAQGSCQ